MAVFGSGNVNGFFSYTIFFNCPTQNIHRHNRYCIPNKQIFIIVCGFWMFFYFNATNYNYMFIWFTEKYKLFCPVTELFENSSIFWDTMPCSLLKVKWYFRGTCISIFKVKEYTKQETFNGLCGVTSQKTEIFNSSFAHVFDIWFPQAAVSQTKQSSYQGTSNCLLIILIKLDDYKTASDKCQLFFISTSGRMPQVFYKTLHFLKIYWDTPQTATTTIYQPWSISETSLTL